MGSDAVSKDEAERIGSLLGLTGIGEFIRSGKGPLPRPDLFIQAVELKKQQLEEQADLARDRRQMIIDKYQKPGTRGGAGAAAPVPQAAPARPGRPSGKPGITLMTNPKTGQVVEVPDADMDKAIKAKYY